MLREKNGSKPMPERGNKTAFRGVGSELMGPLDPH